EAEQHRFDVLILINRAAERAVHRGIDVLSQVGAQGIGGIHGSALVGLRLTRATAARWWRYLRKTFLMESILRRAIGFRSTFQAKCSAPGMPSSCINLCGSSKCIAACISESTISPSAV